VRAMFDTRLPGQELFGAIPEAVALSADGTRLYAANAGSDAVAVFDLSQATETKDPASPVRPLGFIPTEWYPTALAVRERKLYVASAKGRGTGANVDAQRVLDAVPQSHREHAYIGTLLYGSLATIDLPEAEQNLGALTREVEASNLMAATEQHVKF